MSIINFLKGKFQEQGYRACTYLLSPTMLHASYSKSKISECPDQVKDLLIKRNKQYFIITIALVFVIYLFSFTEFTTYVLFPTFLYALSRINEIFIAFTNDASSHLRTEKTSSSLKYHERIPLAMRSYLELILLFGLVFLGAHLWFDGVSCGTDNVPCEMSIWDSIYFSGVTITTLGYGEITPNDYFSKFLVVYEVLNGFTLIVVSFAVYVSKSISNNEAKEP